IAGTPMYMSPEQARGEPTDHHTDLFSLGSVLYTLCAGQPPFRAGTTAEVLDRVRAALCGSVREINPHVPEWLCSLIDKLHAREPSARPGSAREVADLLGRELALLQQPPLASVSSAPTDVSARALAATSHLARLPHIRPVTLAIWLVVLL